jgi:rhamnose utilization protein RhaD (predicted bifunctional aldolase and dehydrogenase)
MTTASSTLLPLLEMTHIIGQPHMDYVIIGEGNTSCRIDDDSFWIKASGQQMNGITESGFVAVKFAPILEMLEQPIDMMNSDEQHDLQEQAMQAAKVDPHASGKPSIEVSFHAMLLKECNVQYIAHTHATAVNRLMCSIRGREFAANRMFPDEVVLCGPESAYVPYVAPGLPLALAIQKSARGYMMDWQREAPKVILMANHGIITLGQTPQEVLNIMAMAVKAANIFYGAYTVGEPVFMSREQVEHIRGRKDEKYRHQMFVSNNASR